jgi:hypothetical protein
MGEGEFYGKAETDRIEVVGRYIKNLGHDHFALAFREIRNLPEGIQEPVSLYCNEVKKQCDILDERLDIALKVLIGRFGEDLTKGERSRLSGLKQYTRQDNDELGYYHNSILNLKGLDTFDANTKKILGSYLEVIRGKLTNKGPFDKIPDARRIFKLFIDFTLNYWNKPLTKNTLGELKTIIFYTNQFGHEVNEIRMVQVNKIDPDIKTVFAKIDKATMDSVRGIASALETFMRTAANLHGPL